MTFDNTSLKNIQTSDFLESEIIMAAVWTYYLAVGFMALTNEIIRAKAREITTILDSSASNPLQHKIRLYGIYLELLGCQYVLYLHVGTAIRYCTYLQAQGTLRGYVLQC